MCLFMMIMLPFRYGNLKQTLLEGDNHQVYSSSTTTCPVQALKNYASFITAKQSHDFVFSAGTFSPLSRSQLTTEVHQLLSQGGMCPSDYASHSFRIRAATTTAAAGLRTSIFDKNTWKMEQQCLHVICSLPTKCHRHNLTATINNVSTTYIFLEPWFTLEHAE